MPGWMSSRSTSRRLDRAFERLTEARVETLDHGHDATTTPLEPTSYFVRPPAVDGLVTFDDGVAAALRRHLTSQGLSSLSALVGDLEAIGCRVRDRDETDDSVSAVVYQMH